MFYFLNDHLGTPQKIVDSTGQVVWAAAYLPFGKAQVTTETVANNLRFPGQYSDAESGLHYNWHRYYDPETGRYITADPIGLAGGINLYAYVLNNPVNGTDPTGRLAPVVIGIIAGGVGGFITGYVGSGGDMMATLKSVVLGAAAGGLAAFVIGAPLVEIVANSNLSLGTGMVAVSAINSVSAGVASAIGQIFGNWANLDPATKNFNQGAVKGAALGGAATVFSSIAGILPELEGSTLWGILQGIYEGSLVGQGELAGGIIENEEKKHPCLNR